MENARVIILSGNKEFADKLRGSLATRGYASSICPHADYKSALAPATSPHLFILDGRPESFDLGMLVADAHNRGAKILLLSQFNGAAALDSILDSGVDFSWPREATEALPAQLPSLLDQQLASPTLLRSLYLSASAFSGRAADNPREANEMETLRAKVTTMQKEMESFTYSVSHDLRAPLRAIDGFTRILLEDYSKQLDEEGQRFLAYVQTNAQQLSRLIDDLLVYHRLGKAEMNAARIDMTELFHAVIDEQRMLEKKHRPGRKVTVEVPKLLPAMADPNLIRQASTQLISNAFKFTRGKEEARIEISSHTENNENVYCVRDNGIGFDMQYAGKLFQVFQKLQRQDEFEGNGIGLAIIHRILQRHGGRAWAEGEPNEGARFCFALPA